MTRTYSTYLTLRVAVEANSIDEANKEVANLHAEVAKVLPTGVSIVGQDANLSELEIVAP